MQALGVPLDELIALRRYASEYQYKPRSEAQRSGSWLSPTRGRGMDFAEVRNYQAGDEIRHMEWRVTARTGRPHVKLYQEERERPVILLSDFNPSMYFGTRLALKSQTAARLAALIAWTAAKEGDRVGGIIFSDARHDEYLPRGRERGVLPYLSGLAQYSEKIPEDFHQSQPLSAILMRSRRVIRPGSTIAIISDGYYCDEDSERHLRRLCQHNLVILYQVCDPIELQPPPPGSYVMSNGKEEVVVDNRHRSVQDLWQDSCVQRQQQLAHLCKRLMIQHSIVQTGDDLAKTVWQSFPRRRHGAY